MRHFWLCLKSRKVLNNLQNNLNKVNNVLGESTIIALRDGSPILRKPPMMKASIRELNPVESLTVNEEDNWDYKKYKTDF